VSEEQNAALGDANEKDVECSRLRALLVEACDIGIKETPIGMRRDRLSQIRALAETEGK
jgi:hypothetical protein